MFGQAATTNFDLRFQILGIPVRVTPWFWLVAALLSRSNDPESILIFVGCVFFSVLIHEFGHGLMAKAFGFRPTIELQGMFGLCYSEAERQTPWQRLAVLICGPGAGFLMVGLIMGLSQLSVYSRLSPVGFKIVSTLYWINLVWSIFNLVPVYPLDGGQMMKVVMMMFSRRGGGRWAHIVSLVLSVLIAALLLMYVQNEFWMAVFFAYFAFLNYQVLQMDYTYAKYGSGDDDDWWRR